MQSKPWYQSTIIWASLVVAILPELANLISQLYPPAMPYVAPIIAFILSVFIIWQRVVSTSTGEITLR